MDSQGLNEAGDLAKKSELAKHTVQAVMDELESLDVSPSVREVRAKMGRNTAEVAAFVSAINAEREAAVEQAIAEELLKFAKKLYGKARESAKSLFAAQIKSVLEEALRVKDERDALKAEVAQLNAQLQQARVTGSAAEHRLATEIAEHQVAERDLVATRESLALAKLEQEHTSAELAQARGDLIVRQRERQEAETNASGLQQQLALMADNLQSERVARLSATELHDRAVAAHRQTQADSDAMREQLAVIRTELARLHAELVSAREETEVVKQELRAKGLEVRRAEERADLLTRANGGLEMQLGLLLKRVEKFAPDITEEFKSVLTRGGA